MIKLNVEQKKAVNHKTGPLLIIAGAGTGKTKVITERIVKIMQSEWAKPHEILALTFTEKAASEMEGRVDEQMPIGYEEPWISTFHSFCDQILRQEAFFLGIDPDYKLMSESESYVFFKQNMFNFSLDELRPLGNPTKCIDNILKHFSRLQDEDVIPQEYIEYVEKNCSGFELELAKTYKEFSELKISQGRMTFADLITNTLKLFREKPQILEKYQNKFKYILVDEYQDTNYSQNVLVNTLALGVDFKKSSKKEREKANITVVGDDDQAIYKFRGAAISNILQFKEIYPEAKRVVLTENFRSNQEILDSAYGLIRNNDPNRLEVTEGIDKRLVSRVSDATGTVKLIPTANVLEEAEAISNEILCLTGNEKNLSDDLNYQVFDSKGQSSFLKNESEKKYNYSDIAILVRANSHADDIVPLLRYYGIPYKFVGKKGLYTRPEVKYFISFLNTLYDYKDNVSMFNVLQMEVWDIEVRDFIEIFSEAKRRKISAFEFLEDVLGVRAGSSRRKSKRNLTEKTFSKKTLDSLKRLMEIYEQAFDYIKQGKKGSEIIYEFFDKSGYLKFLESGGGDSEFRLENISKFFRLMKNFEQNNRESTVYDYIDYLNHSIEVGEVPSIDEDVFLEYDAVNISTVHSAKGLEYPVVFLPSLVKGRFPSRNMSEKLPIPDDLIKEELPEDDDRNTNIQEERRLFYVAATRAKEKLFLSAAKYYGEGKRENKPSVFLNEVLNREELEEFDNVKRTQDFGFMKDGDIEDIDYSSLIRDLGKKVSFSEINDYEKCPKMYKYKYILRIPVSVGHQAVFGTVIHATLRDFYRIHKSVNEGFEGFFEKPTLDDLLNLYYKHWREEGYQDEKHAKVQKKKGEEILKYFYNEIYTGQENVLDLEKNFKVDVAGITVSGVVDRIDTIEGNGVELVDYKTGKLKEQKEVEQDIQLMIYGLFAKQKLGVDTVKASLLFLDAGEKIETEIGEEKIGFVKDKIVDTAKCIQDSKFEPRPDYHGCKFCDYKKICDDANL